jgi:hypothetical protein
VKLTYTSEPISIGGTNFKVRGEKMPTDLEIARDIVANNGPYVGAGGSLPDNVARAVMKGIAAGRQQAADLAQEELAAAEKELTYNLSSSVKERTKVRRNTAKTILDKIKKSKWDNTALTTAYFAASRRSERITSLLTA